jgi:hypothetical protein
MWHETDPAKQHLLMRDFESYVLDDPGARDLLALVASDRPLSVLRQGFEDQPETLPQPGFGYSLARQIGKAYEPA